jgi:RHS repeat-associated protein
VSYTYDDNGNLTDDGTYTYTWSVAGWLTQVESIATTVVYTYNGDGVRVAQEVDGQVTRWVQDMVDLAQVLVETSGGAETIYLYGHARLAQVEGSACEWFLGDALGSVRQIVDDDGAVTLARDYTPFGLLRAEAGTGDSGYGFTGEQGGLGLVYLRARWYDPRTGRFLSKDPFPGYVRLPQTQHGYVYCVNNPVNLTDPSGLGRGVEPAELLPFLKQLLSLMKFCADAKLWPQVVSVVGQSAKVRAWGIASLLSDLLGALSGYTGLSGVSVAGTQAAAGLLGAAAEFGEEAVGAGATVAGKAGGVGKVLETTLHGSEALGESAFFGGLLSVIQFGEGLVGSLELMGPRFDPCTDWTQIHRIKAVSSILKMVSGATGVAAVFSTASILGAPPGVAFGVISAATGIAAAVLDIWVATGWGLDRGGVH